MNYGDQYGYGYGYGYQDYGYSYYSSYYGLNQHYGYTNSSIDASTGYTYIHSIYKDAAGNYYHSLNEDRGPLFDRSVQTTDTYSAETFTTDVLSVSTPMDGQYHSYGTRYTSTYDANTHTATVDQVYFSEGYSLSNFRSFDYATNASVYSVDVRSFYAYGYSEYTSSTYSGPGGYNATSSVAYHYSS